MASLLHVLRWQRSGKWKTKINHTVGKHLQLQSQHPPPNHANLIFVIFWKASKSLKIMQWASSFFIACWINNPAFSCASRVFQKCHKIISVKPFYDACVFDVCHTNISIGCISLETYAIKCAEASECLAWRNATNGICGKRFWLYNVLHSQPPSFLLTVHCCVSEYKCPKNKVYNPCGPSVEPTCNGR